MKRCRKTVMFVLLSLLLALSGCRLGDKAPRVAPPRPPIELPRLEAFEWGGARITLGMTRQQVLAQIAKSGLAEYNGSFGITAPTERMIPQDIWPLSAGNGSGAAPGGGGLRIRFEDGVVVQIVFGPRFA